ncbi:type IV conjugative transfer system protein TraL (plasmid) [Vibrio lentus]
MNNEPLFYSIPKHLNHGKRMMGLPRDEVLPALLLFLLFFFAKHQAIGLAFAIAWFLGLRSIKVQYGENIIALASYWWGSRVVSQQIFKSTPLHKNATGYFKERTWNCITKKI